MSIPEIVKIAPPPTSPLHAGPLSQRGDIEAQLGFALPDDYVEFCSTYGHGIFEMTDLWVHDCFHPEFCGLIDSGLNLLRELQEHARSTSNPFPYDVFPVVPGVFPWGQWRSDDLLWLIDKGDPSKWATVVRFREDVNRNGEWTSWARYDMPMSTFIFRMLTDSLDPSIDQGIEPTLAEMYSEAPPYFRLW